VKKVLAFGLYGVAFPLLFLGWYTSGDPARLLTSGWLVIVGGLCGLGGTTLLWRAYTGRP